MKKNFEKNFRRATVAAMAMTMALGSSGAVLADGSNDDKYVLGDLNGDRVVDIKDNALLKRYLAGWDVEFVSYGLDGSGSQNVDKDKNIPDDAVRYDGNGHYYYIFEADSWIEANAWCKKNGGHLATLTSEAENKFAYEYMKSLKIDDAFFGLTDEETEGVWKWVTGEAFDYSNWDSGQPDNRWGEQHYAWFNDGAPNYIWDDTDDHGGYYICEWDAVVEGDAVATTLTIENVSGGDFIKDVSEATVKFVLNNEASDVSVSVLDVTDTVVYATTFDSCEADKEYEFKWDGKKSDGNYATDGVYKVSVKAGTIETVSDTIRFYTANDFAGGDGSETNPYLVSNLEQLKKVGNKSTKYFKQSANIDANYETLEAMGADDLPFKGHYDGNGCKISNLMIKDGLFYKLEEGSIIENLTFEGCNVSASDTVRIGIITKDNYGTIQNCVFDNKCTANASGENSRVGIICGVNYESGSIMNCTVNDGTVSASGAGSEAGGICGLNRGKIVGSSVSNIVCNSMYNHWSGKTYAGGIAGYNASVGVVSYCEASGKVTSTNTNTTSYSVAGGIVGGNTGQILHCTSDVNVSASGDYSGKIVGFNDNGVVVND